MAAIEPGMINNKEFKIMVEHIPTGQKVSFKSWVTGFQDSFQSQWTGTPVYGRMDDLYTFQKTTRSISLGFSTVAADYVEAKRIQKNLNKLTQFLYPVYSDALALNPSEPNRNSQILEAAPLLKLSWNGLIQDAASGEALVGFLAGLVHQPEINAGQFFSPQKNMVYQQHNVQLEFTVLHTHLTGWTQKDNVLTFGGSKETSHNYPHRHESFKVQQEQERIQALGAQFGKDWDDRGSLDLAREAAELGVDGTVRYEFTPGEDPPLSIPREIAEAANKGLTE